jgi:Tol biopolymer transport system component
MTAPAWSDLEALFYEALARPPEERATFLAERCGGRLDLRGQVEAMLGAHEESGDARLPATGEYTQLNVGARLGPYAIVGQLGAGGMGEVYRARDSRLRRDVAIKILPPAFTADADRVARFEREAQILAALNHPNIAAIYGLEDSPAEPGRSVHALVLELVEGETLAIQISRGPVPVSLALAIARQIAQALEAAHEKGIVHRDLKPANVTVTPAGVVKVLDFGLAKAAAGEAAETDVVSRSQSRAIGSTRVGMILGTAAYMSPEQVKGLPVDNRADIWAFGCVLYEMLTGRRPFVAPTVAATLDAIVEREPDWKALPAGVPQHVRELLRRCLRKDIVERVQTIAEARAAIEQAERGWNRWRVAAIAATMVAAIALAAGFWLRGPAGPADRSEWVQLTQFPDSVIHPALSPDGRMVTFMRGAAIANIPFSRGQVYVKMLPGGEPTQLTNDSVPKMSPVFSPDGGRIAYTTVNESFSWDTWVVPLTGGEPKRWLVNASGLIWSSPGQILFSEIRHDPGGPTPTGAEGHMGIVAADEGRTTQRDVYLPRHVQGMAHLSYLSPDRQSVLLVEMDQNHAWTPCRVVPADRTSEGRLVGPPGAGCTFGAWSPDGRWVYLTSNVGGANHIWRQRFPGGEPEQVTSGPTEEEGIAMASDGRSLVTAVGLRNTSLWLHSGSEERQISLESNAVDAKFTPDGKRLLFKEVGSLGNYPLPGVLRIAELDTGRSDVLGADLRTIDYDVSADGQQVVIEAADSTGISRLWLARLDGRLPPRQIPDVEGKQPRFGPAGDIYFRRPEGTATFVYRIRGDGTGLQKVLDAPIALMGDVSPDGRWIIGWRSVWYAFSLDGRPPIVVGTNLLFDWSPDGKSASIFGGPLPQGRSYLVPLSSGEALPRIPADGFQTEQEIADLPGARRVDVRTVPASSPDTYAFYRTTTQRNLYRIPLR